MHYADNDDVQVKERIEYILKELKTIPRTFPKAESLNFGTLGRPTTVSSLQFAFCVATLFKKGLL